MQLAGSKANSNIGTQTRRLLLIGFGGLLLLLAFMGVNALSVLNRIQTQNEGIRRDYVNRDRILEALRSDIYLSGTHVRDFLLEPDLRQSELYRAELNTDESRVDAMIVAYEAILRGEEKLPFGHFKSEVGAYFDSLRPALQWSPEQRKELGFSFMKKSLLPRRLTIVRLADQISLLNQEQMNAGNQEVVALFSKFRSDLSVLLAATLIGGLLLAGGSIFRILRLEAISTTRFTEVLEARRALRDLSARLVEVQESERRALSRELHDDVGQSLSALLLALGNVAAMIPPNEHPEIRAELLDTRRLAERTVATVRDMCLALRPSMLDDLGLIPALEWQAREISRTSLLQVTVHGSAASAEDLSDDQKTCIYRVVQEALRNVLRHAKAKQAQVRLSETAEAIHLEIKDNGQGFSPAREKGLGILGMQERVKHLGGRFDVRSSPGQGAVIEVDLPKLLRSSGREDFRVDQASVS